MPYLALWKVADADFPTAPNPTPTAKPSETGRRKNTTVRSCSSPEAVPPPALKRRAKQHRQGSRAPGQLITPLILVQALCRSTRSLSGR